MNTDRIDLRCHPYRGIIKEIADELDMDSGNVHRALFSRKNPNPKLAEVYNRKLQERQKQVNKFKKSVRQAS